MVENDEKAIHEAQLEVIDEYDLQSVIRRMNAVTKFSEEWFRLKELEMSLRDESGVDEVSDDGKSSNKLVNEDETIADAQIGTLEDSVNTSLTRPEQMQSMNDAPVPVGMESFVAAVNVEKAARCTRKA